MGKGRVRFYFLLGLGFVFIYGAVLGRSTSPKYLWLFVPGIIFSLLSYLEYRRLEKRKLLAKLRGAWGEKEKKRDRNFEEIAYLFETAAKADVIHDTRTWDDLNMKEIFSLIDRTFTWPGLQRLYQILRLPVINDRKVLTRRNEIISFFQKNPAQREELQCILSGADIRIGSGLAFLLWDDPDVKPIHPLFLYNLMSISALLSPLLLIFGARYLVVILLIFQFNMYLHFKVQREIKAHFEGVRSLQQLIGIGKKLGASQHEELNDLLGRVRAAVEEVKHFSRIAQFVGLEVSDPMLNIFEQYYTIFLLAEVRGFFKALKFIGEKRQALQSLFLAVGEIDALQSVASFRDSVKYYCQPNFVGKRVLDIKEAYHPLLVDPVPNSIKAGERGILVTGSNMSGKSTFLRTVGLNVLLAQTIATCLAASYTACPVRLLTSIGRADNIVEGTSYYLEEALGVRRVLDAANRDPAVLAIFDEIFRGTNSEERIFAAQRVLEFLICRNALVLVATHDLELVDLLAEGYTSMHFSERVGSLGLEFDYKLKKGPATTRNAIALLRYLNYPEEITN